MKRLIEYWQEMMMNLIYSKIWINKDMNKKKNIMIIFHYKKIID